MSNEIDPPSDSCFEISHDKDFLKSIRKIFTDAESTVVGSYYFKVSKALADDLHFSVHINDESLEMGDLHIDDYVIAAVHNVPMLDQLMVASFGKGMSDVRVLLVKECGCVGTAGGISSRKSGRTKRNGFLFERTGC